jgi:hypothetical protein
MIFDFIKIAKEINFVVDIGFEEFILVSMNSQLYFDYVSMTYSKVNYLLDSSSFIFFV